MTRINVISPFLLCDQHLLAEHREIIRIPNYILKKNGLVKLTKLKSYILGKGHVIFFRNKLLFLYFRYFSIYKECLNRGFLVSNLWPYKVKNYLNLWNDYKITERDIKINQIRIMKKMPKKPRFTTYKRFFINGFYKLN